ncbi:MAG: hypothetical protein IT337_13975 [Thermomicrobiales bacterium]|nr:hypothetical protein [Thermomicrobiales bacterium]
MREPDAARSSAATPRSGKFTRRRPSALRRHGLASALMLAGILLALLPLLEHAGPGLPQVGNGMAVAKSDRTRRAAEPCPGGQTERVNGGKLCSHGPDPAPPGVDIAQRATPARRAKSSANRAACRDDGVSGPRVQTLYVYSAEGVSAYERYLASFQTWADAADRIFLESARATGGDRQVRFVTGPDCRIDVRPVAVSAASLNDFWATVQAISEQGHNRTDRKYLMFVDATRYCGIASVVGDDRPGSSNANNRGPSYARVDAGCWASRTAVAHELMHTMGSVQNSAPNTSRGFHCIDTFDVMCYSDAPYYPTMIQRCSNEFMTRFDCGADDYYNAAPRAGSYLATHWNAANNVFLYGVEQQPPVAHASLTARPQRARAKRAITIELRGFAPGEQTTVRWQAAGVVRTVTASAAGAASLRFAVPAKTKRGRSTIVATGSAGSRATTTVQVKGRR